MLNQWAKKFKYGEKINYYLDKDNLTKFRGKYTPKTNKRLSWRHKKAIKEAQSKKNSNYKHGKHREYRKIADWIPNTIIHHIDDNHNNNDPNNLIPIPSYILTDEQLKGIKSLKDWRRVKTARIHEAIHRRNAKEKKTLPSRKEIEVMIEKEYPGYHDHIRPKMKRRYRELQVKDMIEKSTIKDKLIKYKT